MSLEVTFIPPAPELTSLPQELVEYFEAQGKQILLVHGGPNNMAMESAYQRSPVYWDDIDNDRVRRLMRASFEPPERSGGIVMRGTMALVQQSLEARDYFRGVSEQRKLAMQDASDNAAEVIEDNVNRMAKDRNPGMSKKFVDIRTVPGSPKVEEQAIGGQELLETVLRQESSKKK